MNKWPNKIYKQKFSFGELSGNVWLDRWSENTWFETKDRLYVPLQVRKLIAALPVYKQLNLMCKLVYNEPIKNLIYSENPLLKLIPKTDYKPVIIPLEWK